MNSSARSFRVLLLGAAEEFTATWSVRRESSGIRDLRLQFTIRREAGTYYVRGIKEVN